MKKMLCLIAASSMRMAPRRSAIIMAWASLSITHGPAIRNNGAVCPNRIFPIEKLRMGAVASCSFAIRGNRLCGIRDVFNFEFIGADVLPVNGSFHCFHERC